MKKETQPQWLYYLIGFLAWMGLILMTIFPILRPFNWF